MTGKQQKEVSEEIVSQEQVISEEGSPVEVVPEEVISEVETQKVEDQLDEVMLDSIIETEAEAEEITGEEITIESLSEQVEALKKSVAESLDKAIRAQAELDNVRKRAIRDIENAHKYSLDKFINELLPVLDSMELGISATDNAEDISSLREGMDLTMKMLFSALEKSGVSPVDPQKGDKFNPDQHDAVTMQELDDAETGTVISTLQKGYELNGRLIRPAMVIVAK